MKKPPFCLSAGLSDRERMGKMLLSELPGMGPVRCRALQEAGIRDARDLVERLPEQYQDSTHPVPLAELAAGMTAAFSGRVRGVRCHWLRRQALVSLTLEEDGAALRCVWFGAVWLSQQLAEGQRLLLYGRIARGKDGRLQAVHPALVDKPALLPVYRAVEKVPPKSLREAIRHALDSLPDSSEVPEELVEPLYPGTRKEALICAHFPASREALEQARRRLSYETLLLYQAGLRLLRGSGQSGVALSFQDSDLDRFWEAQAFAPTMAQRCVALEIASDLRAPYAMARLVQGDVGCGKTAIAFSALYACAVGGYQGAMMAPTEVLAAQHFQSSRRMLEPLGIRCGLLTGRLTAKQRREAYAAIASGQWQAVFGTHALISAGVRFHKLGLAITDEQHRFGVQQRSALAQKADNPNVLVMSATPIPRTLALLMYGDLALSVVDELPPGRMPVQTRFVPERKRDGLYRFLREQVNQGQQAYIVCPLVEESETEDCLSASLHYEMLQEGPLRDLRVGLVHGAMAGAEKDRALADFHSGTLDVLVSTTVIEVGVDAPNATIMIIENPERFGLSQLHQLRGRVGRGKAQSWCFLMGEPNERLSCLVETTDGFAIAQKDLDLRGPGEFLGVRQHGLPELGSAGCVDLPMLEQAHRAVQALMNDSSRAEQARRLLEAARTRYAQKLDAAALN